MENSPLEILNERQKEAATACTGHVRIIAGAGSGKTRVLMNRIAWLIEEAGIFPWKILAITFTNKAAREMRERLDAMLGPDAKDVRISTIHSFCLRMLREDGQALGYPKGFTVLDPEDQKAILRPIYKDMEADRSQLPPAKVLGMISNWKSALIPPERAKEMAMTLNDRIAAEIYARYESALQDMQAMDFDDLLLNARRLLQKEEIREKWHQRLSYLHVDEFQDVDPIQYDILRLLTGPEACLCVVGDPDQTIYTWRGASVDIILQFEKDFPNTHTVILDENYRNTQPILDAANALIAHNQNRIKKDLHTQNAGEKKICEFEAGEENQEPLEAARAITEARKQGRPWSEFAVLYRSNYLSRSFERIFTKLHIPYIIYGGIRFYERQEIKDMLSYLKLLEEPRSSAVNLAVQRVINVPSRRIGAVTVAKVLAQAESQGTDMLTVLEEPKGFSSAIAGKLKSFAAQVEEWKAQRKTLPLDKLLLHIAEDSGYLAMLEEAHEEERLENIQELANDIRQALADKPDMSLEDYLQDITLYTNRQSEEKTDAVNLMTVHAAKGLEFDQVHIVGLNEEVFPARRALEEGGRHALEEERRLLYVAMTRARKELYLSWNLGYSIINEGHRLPSRFLKEIPRKLVEKEEPVAAKVESRTPIQKRRQKLRRGDLISHAVYGQGVIVSLNDDIASIAFAHPTGVKKMNVNHPSIQKQ